ncbi:histidinol-phosphate/aromatic aminotransferase/cobyric acid decarboxylase-like protein/choline kinase [Parabacteroides sp. PFB2-12]|uniref:aminotransferase class I/II-fold pyridoxal phosphate-dependent enzyme n=1 Tax=unclassified Parabacteroides TaxID=2649774 RepID=UPI0024770EA9|nr:MULTISPECIES: aminotransferase class I/II-fold pyridoxal phosphate-dependent enzyme [unclassified Parabacteroides]MDH6343480.1 histidinol-phosphate/aromatic aminotransferase/cobyric acid decarboxylase-like protein/choline kinase [Parabacteroides sp. PM6-13]MDH6390920.1 histidinol-phosphate/aromatic aminotransferase/cobyric acid decarboxylase-like protein/choline kinase [Parabacteroides sp. PFB2-12]
MQAIILAAGMGKRLGDLTKDNTKCMLKVHGVTLIERMLKQLTTYHLNRIVIVIGYKGENVRSLIGDSYMHVPIEYIYNSVYDKTNNIYSLYLAKEKLREDDTILLESDLIFSDEILRKLIEDPSPNLAVVAKYQSWMDGTVVTLGDDSSILSFVPKNAFRYEDVSLYYKTVNIYKFNKDFLENKYIPFLEAYCKALGNNEYYEQVLRVISLLNKPDLKAMPLNDEPWYEIDDQQDLTNAETLFAESNEMLKSYGSRYGGYWRFPFLLDFCYLVNPFFPTVRMKEEMKAYFDTLLTQYPSGMKVNAELAARYMNVKPSQIVVGNGAAELIQACLRDNNLTTGVILPTFEEYPNRINKELLVYYEPENDSFSYSVEDLICFYEKHPIRQLILINPDNPSGNFIKKEDVLHLIEWTKQQNIRLIIDESFIDFATDDERYTLFDPLLLTENPHLILIKSISKSYGVPGVRLGFVASGDEKLIGRIKKEVSIWNINSFAEFYMQIYVKYADDYKNACISFVKERESFYSQLTKIPFLRVIPSSANYFLIEVTSTYTSQQLCELLLQNHNILIKDCSTKQGFDGKEYVRIAIKSKEENHYLSEVLKLL